MSDPEIERIKQNIINAATMKKMEKSINKRHRSCNHGNGRAWKRELVNKMPHYVCRHCNATVAEVIKDETITKQEMKDPFGTVLRRPDFGAPCVTINTALAVREAMMRGINRLEVDPITGEPIGLMRKPKKRRIRIDP